jgi:hypothetical protein
VAGDDGWRYGTLVLTPSLRANGSRECAPDDRLREANPCLSVIASAAKQSISLRKERLDCFVASLLAMTEERGASPSLRANGSRECAPDDRLREAIHRTAKKKESPRLHF